MTRTSTPTRAHRPYRLFIVVAVLLALLIGVAVYNVISVVREEKNAPASAPYSSGANPDFYTDLQKTAASHPDAKAALTKLSAQPVAEWLSTDASKAAISITRALSVSRANGTLPIFVLYAIPDRDLGGYSAGGLSADGYRGYLRSVSSVLADAPAIVIVEPDALAHMPDLSADKRALRAQLLAEALDVLHGNVNTAAYLDAGNSAWRSADETAGLLKRVDTKTENGITRISLNVANFQSDSDSQAYGTAVARAYGQALKLMIDSSRNGGSTAKSDWCNPKGQRLGTADTRFDADAAVEHAFIKTPGESDGMCGISGKQAGEFDPDLLLTQLGLRG